MFQTAAEYERRRENFFKEIEIVFADVVCLCVSLQYVSCIPELAFKSAVFPMSAIALQSSLVCQSSICPFKRLAAICSAFRSVYCRLGSWTWHSELSGK